MNFDSSAVQPCARRFVRGTVAATRTVARGSLPAPRVDGVPACNRWGSTSDAWVQRDLTETVAAPIISMHYQTLQAHIHRRVLRRLRLLLNGGRAQGFAGGRVLGCDKGGGASEREGNDDRPALQSGKSDA